MQVVNIWTSHVLTDSIFDCVEAYTLRGDKLENAAKRRTTLLSLSSIPSIWASGWRKHQTCLWAHVLFRSTKAEVTSILLWSIKYTYRAADKWESELNVQHAFRNLLFICIWFIVDQVKRWDIMKWKSVCALMKQSATEKRLSVWEEIVFKNFSVLIHIIVRSLIKIYVKSKVKNKF